MVIGFLKTMKILEICEFSKGICGVFQRVLAESIELKKKGHEVIIFSSDVEKGTGNRAPKEEVVSGILIKRFPARKSVISEHVTFFDFEKELLDLHPDRIITHTIHPHSFKALRIAQKKAIPCYLVTHAPFAIKRNPLLQFITKWYYQTNVRANLQKFTKVIAITDWELPYLSELGLPKEKIEYIPNGVPDVFFEKSKTSEKKNTILFLGRVAPIKGLEILFKAIDDAAFENISVFIVGPIEKGYESIRTLAPKNVSFVGPVHDLLEKKKIIESAEIFVLPSLREAMPQSLIEAMALGKIVVASETLGAKEIVTSGKDGFLFPIGDVENLRKILKEALHMNKNEKEHLSQNAQKKVEQFAWKNLIKKWEKVLKSQ